MVHELEELVLDWKAVPFYHKFWLLAAVFSVPTFVMMYITDTQKILGWVSGC